VTWPRKKETMKQFIIGFVVAGGLAISLPFASALISSIPIGDERITGCGILNHSFRCQIDGLNCGRIGRDRLNHINLIDNEILVDRRRRSGLAGQPLRVSRYLTRPDHPPSIYSAWHSPSDTRHSRSLTA